MVVYCRVECQVGRVFPELISMPLEVKNGERKKMKKRILLVDDEVAVLLISHDITVVAQVCDRVLVMYAGRIVEDLPATELATGARHPYTRALLAAVPDLDTPLDEPLAVIPGRPVDPSQFPSGCAFAARCEFAEDRCRTEDPTLVSHGPDQEVACWNPQGTAAWQARYLGNESIRTVQR